LDACGKWQVRSRDAAGERFTTSDELRNFASSGRTPVAGNSPTLKQDDIEELLRQAQLASGMNPEGAGTPDAGAAAPAPSAADVRAAPSESAATAATATAETPRPAFVPRAAGAKHVGDDVDYLLAQAEQAIASVAQPIDPGIPGLTPFELKDLAGSPASGDKATLELLKDVDLDLRIELGRTRMYLEDVLKLKRGSVVTLDKLAGDPVDVYVNGRLVARGEVLVLNDNFCVRVTELLKGDEFE
jgi:flagellar motor switch protein FliN/FliY